MKKLISLMYASLGITGIVHAQTASATWALTADTASLVIGNISAPAQYLSKTPAADDTLSVKDYVGGTASTGSPVGLAERIWCNGSNWPNESAQNNGRYIKYSITPYAGYTLTISSIMLNIGCFGTNAGYFHANIFYSTDSTLTTKIQLNASALTLPDIRTNSMTALSYTPSVAVDSGKTFYVLIYPYYSSTPSATKYVCLTNVIISGTTIAAGAPSLIVSPPSISFGTAKVNATRDRMIILSGTNLTPSSDSIHIDAPSGFGVSTILGSGYSSSITLPYSRSTLNLDTVFVRFMPSVVKLYDGNITVSGGGIIPQTVAVSGNSVSPSMVLGIFVSSTGNDADSGTYTHPYLTLQKALSVVQPGGDTIFVRAGRYPNSVTITLSASGTMDKRICLYAYPPDNIQPVLDFSSMTYGSSHRGIQMTGNYWHIKGLDIFKAGDNGLNISGSFNIVEYCAFHENRDGGCQLGGGAAYNQIINCDSYFNFDDSTTTSGTLTPGGNADGFAPKLDVGTGNYFYGCRSWQNSDDGWDGFQETVNDDTTYLVNCWTWKNGFLKDGTHPYSGMNGNGFKMGGNNLVHNFIANNCLSFNNYSKGFDQNNGTGSLTILNCTAYKNTGKDYSVPGPMAAGKQLILENCISYTNNVTTAGPTTRTIKICSWTGGFTTPSASDFLSIDTTGISGPRKPDGSLPDIKFMHLVTGSQFIDAGTDVGLPYNGTKPDLGCFETSGSTEVPDNNDARMLGFRLRQNYPNPFNPTTVISYQLSGINYVNLSVFDVLGRKVATLVDEKKEAGNYSVQWNAETMPSGIYFYRLTTYGYSLVRKMILMK